MAAPKKSTAKKSTRKNPADGPEGRSKSLLVQAGEDTMRRLLLATLKEHEWSLVRVAEALEMYSPSTVIKSIKSLGLEAEYAKAKERGDVRPGPRND